MSVSNGPHPPKRLPRPDAEAELLKENIGLLRGEVAFYGHFNSGLG
jgi:hypothetical protein